MIAGMYSVGKEAPVSRDPITSYFFSIVTMLWSTLIVARICKEWLRMTSGTEL